MSLPSRPSSFHHTSSAGNSSSGGGIGGGSASSSSSSRQRQYAHLAAQLAQLNARLADLENLVRMTSVQAGDVRGLGGWMGGLFMASSKILGEESIASSQGAKEAEMARRRAESMEEGRGGRTGKIEEEEEEEGVEDGEGEE